MTNYSFYLHTLFHSFTSVLFHTILFKLNPKFKMQVSIAICLAVAICGIGFQGAEAKLGEKDVEIFNDEDFQGVSEVYQLPPGQCVNIEPAFSGHISSIMPGRWACVLVYTNRDCVQITREATPQLRQYSPGTDKLVRLGLNDRILSMKAC